MWIVLAAPTRTATRATVDVRWQDPAASTRRRALRRRIQWTLRKEGQGSALDPQGAGRPLDPVT